METATVIGPPAERSKYLRPLLVCLSLCLAGELFLFAVYGLVLFPEGNVLHKLAWAALCGVGMGLTTGGLVDLLIVDRALSQAVAKL